MDSWTLTMRRSFIKKTPKKTRRKTKIDPNVQGVDQERLRLSMMISNLIV
jgi:hypothetical protein